MTKHAGVHLKGTFNFQNVMENARKNPDFPKAGAIASFIGIVRDENNEKQRVVSLTMEAYEEKANDILNMIANELSRKPGIVDVQIHHLLGEFKVGEEIVYVSVAGGHREEVFSVLREAVERYKKEAPVFKKERIITPEGESEYWVSEKRHFQR